MADNKRNTFLKGLLGKISGGLKEVPHLNEIQKMRQETGETDLKTKKMKKELVDKMMARYPKAWKGHTDGVSRFQYKRLKGNIEFLVKQGKMKAARDLTDKRSKEDRRYSSNSTKLIEGEPF